MHSYSSPSVLFLNLREDKTLGKKLKCSHTATNPWISQLFGLKLAQPHFLGNTSELKASRS